MSHRVSLPLPLSRPDGCQVRGAAGFRGNNEIECLFRFPGLGLVAGVARVPHQSFTLAGILLQCVTCRFASFFCVRGVCEKRLIWNLPWEPTAFCSRSILHIDDIADFSPSQITGMLSFRESEVGGRERSRGDARKYEKSRSFFYRRGKKKGRWCGGGSTVPLFCRPSLHHFSFFAQFCKWPNKTISSRVGPPKGGTGKTDLCRAGSWRGQSWSYVRKFAGKEIKTTCQLCNFAAANQSS